MNARLRAGSGSRRHRGVGLVELIVVLPVLLLGALGLIQLALFFHAKSNVNYAIFEAARAGSTQHADAGVIALAFKKAMLPYYGGGRTEGELAAIALDMAWRDLALLTARIEILSPTRASFEDYGSPAARRAADTDEPVMPSVGLDELRCPRDMPGCNADPATNRSGQTLQDANLLKLRVTYGIPPFKQVPMVGKLLLWGLALSSLDQGDAYQAALVASGRIPVVASAVVRMQSDAIQNSLMR